MTHEGKRVVLVAVDESELAEKALNYYIDNVMKPDDYVCLAYVPETYYLDFASPAAVDKLLREVQENVTALESKYSEKVRENHMKGKFRTGKGKPGEVICKMAEEEKAEMIVVGSRGLGKIRRTILGSVSSYIIHHAHVPVLICKDDTKESKHHHQKKA